LTCGIAEAGSDCWWPSSPTLLSAGPSLKTSQVAQNHAQLYLELLQRMHLQGWSFPSLRAAPFLQWIVSPLMFNQHFPSCKSQPLPPGSLAGLHPLSTQISVGEGHQLSSSFAYSMCPAQTWYHRFGGSGVPLDRPGCPPSQAPQAACWFWHAPKTPRAQDTGKHLPLPGSRGIWVPKCWSLAPLLCDLQRFRKSGLSDPAPRSPSLFPRSMCKQVVGRMEEMAYSFQKIWRVEDFFLYFHQYFTTFAIFPLKTSFLMFKWIWKWNTGLLPNRTRILTHEGEEASATDEVPRHGMLSHICGQTFWKMKSNLCSPIFINLLILLNWKQLSIAPATLLETLLKSRSSKFK